jgi:cytochrome c peroxidase
VHGARAYVLMYERSPDLSYGYLSMRRAMVFGSVAAGLWLSACDDGPPLIDGTFTDAEWQKISSFSPLPPPPASPTNRFADDPRAAAFGQRLWFEKRYAGPIKEGTPDEGSPGVLEETGKVACSDCHDPEHWFTDTRSKPNRVSLGTARTRHNSPSMVNAAYYRWGGWGGPHDQMWKQAATVFENRDSFNSDRLTYAHVIYTYYRTDYNALFSTPLDPALDAADTSGRFPPSGKPNDPAWETMSDDDRLVVNTIVANCGKSVEAYERRLVSRDAPFDRYVAGDFGALTKSAKRGLKLFIGKAGCTECHQHETFTDQEFHNTGVAQTMPDQGRFDDVLRLHNPFDGAGVFSDDPIAGAEKLAGITRLEEMRGQFRTKSLRHVTQTGPYFHNGSVDSLADVVRFYNRGGDDGSFPGEKDARIVPLNLREREIEDLVEFLGALTGEPVPEQLTRNTAATAPVP